MSKKIFVAAVAALALGATVHAQTNFQTFYDFGRKHFTTTLEGFHQDNWGNTFFFIDYDYNNKGPSAVHGGLGLPGPVRPGKTPLLRLRGFLVRV